jgi:2-polyprenyl-6-hydroxyphenyl methylase/3-demethylubiquinone-9 3-methyltransferase
VLARAFGRDPSNPAPLCGLDVLDVGCGGGILSESLARLGASVHGIDVVERNVEIACRHAQDSGVTVRYEALSASALVERGVDYDIVLNMEVVEYVPDVPALLKDCARLVRPAGAMVVATINRTALSWLFAIVGAEYVLRWLPRGTHRWRQFVPPATLERLLDDNGFGVIERTGVRVNPFNRHFALTRLMAVNYMLVARRSAPTIPGTAS